jgi:transcriptional regulator with XRE-family HTH domain
MSQRDVASVGGVASSTVSRAEDAATNLTIETVVQIADGLGASRLAALIEAGVVAEIDRDAAQYAALFAGLTGERRELAWAVLSKLAQMEERAKGNEA